MDQRDEVGDLDYIPILLASNISYYFIINIDVIDIQVSYFLKKRFTSEV